MDVRLSDRLRAIAHLVPAGAQIVDVGTDHALLPAYLMTTGRVKSAIASDIVAGPVKAAVRTLQQYQLAEVIPVRLGPGLTTVTPGEADTALVAGMGGATIVDVLAESPDVVETLRTCIFQPMNASAKLRRFLYGHNWHLKVEDVILDDGRLYEVLSVQRSQSDLDLAYEGFYGDEVAMDCAFHFGPLNLQRADSTVFQLIHQTVERWQEIVTRMTASHSATHALKRDQLSKRLSFMTSWMAQNASKRR